MARVAPGNFYCCESAENRYYETPYRYYVENDLQITREQYEQHALLSPAVAAPSRPAQPTRSSIGKDGTAIALYKNGGVYIVLLLVKLEAALPLTEAVASSTLQLHMHLALTEAQQHRIIEALGETRALGV